MFGVDEAGRGPLAGPLSFAAVKFSKEKLEQILRGNLLPQLNDSKKISEKKREEIYEEIVNSADLVLHQFISNKFIDKYGISISIFDAIRRLVIKSREKSIFLLIDGNYNFLKRQAEKNFQFNYRSIVKGDARIASIAAASIVAKVRRDRYMNRVAEYYPDYQFEKHKGYGTELHIQKIREFGYSS
ncbi:MAG TPA: ribonuclease HII, partial [Leptospiraceae bacterium]|nr:ribonuclease HII [Leptospiraceae bacterium]